MFFNQKFSEEWQMHYAEVNGAITIIGYDGDETNVVIPAELDGLPVTRIEPYAFTEKSMKYIQFPDSLLVIDHHGFSECRNLSRLDFPAKLTTIGNYAFYNCWDIVSVHFTPYIRSIGFGAFMNCEKLNDIIQDILPGHENSLNSLMDELIHEIHLEIHYMQPDGSYEIAKATFTEYTAEVVANMAVIASMCKQFTFEYSGSGRSLRYCISSKGVDFKVYDSMFIKIFFKDSFDIAITVAMERLMYPYGMVQKAREDYTAYVQEHAAEALSKFISEDDMEKLTFLADMDVLDEAAVDAAIDRTSSQDKTEFTAFLMDYKHSHFSMEDMDFNLDF